MSQAQIQQEREQQRKHQEEMALLNGAQAAHDTPEDIRRDLIQDLKDSPLSEGSREVLRNLISPDFIFAYYNSDEIGELKELLRLKKRQFLWMHPAQECEVTGDDRAYINDDPRDTLEPLSDAEHLVVDTYFKGVYARVTRAKEMKQQEILQTSISENRVQRESKSDSSGRGLKGRLFG